LYQADIPAHALFASQFSVSRIQSRKTYLHITELIKVHIPGKLLLNRTRPRTTSPPPQIITLPALILLGSVHARRDAPHNHVPQHDHPAERRRDVARDIRFLDAEAVREDGGEVEHDGHGRDGKVHPRRPGACSFCPCGARDGVAVDENSTVGVLRAEEFDERHGDGDEDGEGDEESEDAGEGAEVADACFEDLGELTWDID
jgi:hypothetical protein